MKRISTLLAVVLLVAVMLTGCQSAEQFYGDWQLTVTETIPIDASNSIDISVVGTLSINEDETFALTMKVEDEAKLESDIIAIFDNMYAEQLASTGVSEEEFEEAISAQLGMSWDDFVNTNIDTVFADLDSVYASQSVTGTWVAGGETITLTEDGVTDEIFDVMTLGEGVLVGVDGSEFTKAA